MGSVVHDSGVPSTQGVSREGPCEARPPAHYEAGRRVC